MTASPGCARRWSEKPVILAVSAPMRKSPVKADGAPPSRISRAGDAGVELLSAHSRAQRLPDGGIGGAVDGRRAGIALVERRGFAGAQGLRLLAQIHPVQLGKAGGEPEGRGVEVHGHLPHAGEQWREQCAAGVDGRRAVGKADLAVGCQSHAVHRRRSAGDDGGEAAFAIHETALGKAQAGESEGRGGVKNQRRVPRRRCEENPEQSRKLILSWGSEKEGKC